jgi:ataxia telangiectasia mutated family protein
MALLKVQHKLQGLESDGALSIEGQVKKLMTDAQDPQLLSQMYPGWGAWI